MKASLQLKLGQQLTMTPQLQQAIRLLQLSSLELQQEIQQALDSNPLLELEEDQFDATKDPVNQTLSDKKPLSDSKMAQLLAEQGINVARRTIAKYREAMLIPPSNQRKSL